MLEQKLIQIILWSIKVSRHLSKVQRNDLSLELSGLLLLWLRGLLILLDVEFAKEHNSFVTEDVRIRRITWIDIFTTTTKLVDFS